MKQKWIDSGSVTDFTHCLVKKLNRCLVLCLILFEDITLHILHTNLSYAITNYTTKNDVPLPNLEDMHPPFTSCWSDLTFVFARPPRRFGGIFSQIVDGYYCKILMHTLHSKDNIEMLILMGKIGFCQAIFTQSSSPFRWLIDELFFEIAAILFLDLG